MKKLLLAAVAFGALATPAFASIADMQSKLDGLQAQIRANAATDQTMLQKIAGINTAIAKIGEDMEKWRHFNACKDVREPREVADRQAYTEAVGKLVQEFGTHICTTIIPAGMTHSDMVQYIVHYEQPGLAQLVAEHRISQSGLQGTYQQIEMGIARNAYTVLPSPQQLERNLAGEQKALASATRELADFRTAENKLIGEANDLHGEIMQAQAEEQAKAARDAQAQADANFAKAQAAAAVREEAAAVKQKAAEENAAAAQAGAKADAAERRASFAETQAAACDATVNSPEFASRLAGYSRFENPKLVARNLCIAARDPNSPQRQTFRNLGFSEDYINNAF
jgi:hypothetical protein